jgi:hypothetical protein
VLKARVAASIVASIKSSGRASDWNIHTDKSRIRSNVDYLLKNCCSEDLRTTGVDSLRLNAEVELTPIHTKLTLSYLPYDEFRMVDAFWPMKSASEKRLKPDLSLHSYWRRESVAFSS